MFFIFPSISALILLCHRGGGMLPFASLWFTICLCDCFFELIDDVAYFTVGQMLELYTPNRSGELLYKVVYPWAGQVQNTLKLSAQTHDVTLKLYNMEIYLNIYSKLIEAYLSIFYPSSCKLYINYIYIILKVHIHFIWNKWGDVMICIKNCSFVLDYK